MPRPEETYFLLEEPHSLYDGARAAILPLPFERTTTYGKGTARGPAAILLASHALELYDDELDSEPFRIGVATLPPLLPESPDLGAALGEIRAEARRHLEAGKVVVALGGEHSLSSALALAARDVHGEVGVVQLDAHADLREEYEGSPWSHAAVMRRLVDAGFPTLAVGIRSLSTPEAELVRERELPILWGRDLQSESVLARFRRRLEALPDRVYLTIDIDFFDPALVPATGTPEPGGAAWYPTLALLRSLFRRKRVVAMDLVELAPIAGQPASDFLAAKLVYKCLGYLQEAEKA
ncbi:MAG TPA: agmatinase [Thermoanaerobaculia bacterium]|nr:agmatinase [Thermoanaerobaculia bacterium]